AIARSLVVVFSGSVGNAEKRELGVHPNQVSQAIIGAAMEVHRSLGPGLLESAYQRCLAREFELRGLPYNRECLLALDYKGLHVDSAYRVDFVVAKLVVVEVKSVVALTPIDEAQLLTYLRLGNWPLGLLINFNVPVLKDGIRRKVSNLQQ